MIHREATQPRARYLGLAAALCGLLSTLGCSAETAEPIEPSESPARITPTLATDIARQLRSAQASTDMTLNACTLIGLSPARVATLTGTNLANTSPPKSGETPNICTYGGPGADTNASSTSATTSATATPATTTAAQDGLLTGFAELNTTSPSATNDSSGVRVFIPGWPLPGMPTAVTTIDPDLPLDTVTAAVVRPEGDVNDALSHLPTQLSATYACSEVRGSASAQEPSSDEQPTSDVEPEPGVGPVEPELATAYLDCTTTPLGGGTEVHTIFVENARIWHLVVTQQGVARSPESQERALSGAHRLAMHILN